MVFGAVHCSVESQPDLTRVLQSKDAVEAMKAMVLTQIGDITPASVPLEVQELPPPVPSEQDLLIQVSTCGICHTELDEIEGRTRPPSLPVILGHQVVGMVAERGRFATEYEVGDRVGVAWIYSACGRCPYCRRGLENLCADFRGTGRDVNGGYAEFMTVPAAFAHAIPEVFSDSGAAPLLCAGAIGYRALRLAGVSGSQRLGLTGFGGSGHLVLKMVRHRFPEMEVFVFARSERQRQFAMSLGAVWVGDSREPCPTTLDAIIDTTPAWGPAAVALGNLAPGGRLVINAIRKESADARTLLGVNYEDHLWMEKEIKTVANVTRDDVKDFLALAAEVPIRPEVQEYALLDANQALIDLKTGHSKGAKVLSVRSGN